MRCPSCGALYNVDEVQFMGSQEGYFLLSMTCAKCSLPVWVNFFSGSPDGRSVLNDLTIDDLELSTKPAITPNEVLDFHNFITGFNGDFKKYLKK